MDNNNDIYFIDRFYEFDTVDGPFYCYETIWNSNDMTRVETMGSYGPMREYFTGLVCQIKYEYDKYIEKEHRFMNGKYLTFNDYKCKYLLCEFKKEELGYTEFNSKMKTLSASGFLEKVKPFFNNKEEKKNEIVSILEKRSNITNLEISSKEELELQKRLLEEHRRIEDVLRKNRG